MKKSIYNGKPLPPEPPTIPRCETMVEMLKHERNKYAKALLRGLGIKP